MDNFILNSLLDVFTQASGFVKTRNYYFEHHKCNGVDVKVMMDFKLKVETNDNLVKLGMCPHCKTVFYHEDSESNSL